MENAAPQPTDDPVYVLPGHEKDTLRRLTDMGFSFFAADPS